MVEAFTISDTEVHPPFKVSLREYAGNGRIAIDIDNGKVSQVLGYLSKEGLKPCRFSEAAVPILKAMGVALDGENKIKVI